MTSVAAATANTVPGQLVSMVIANSAVAAVGTTAPVSAPSLVMNCAVAAVSLLVAEGDGAPKKRPPCLAASAGQIERDRHDTPLEGIGRAACSAGRAVIRATRRGDRSRPAYPGDRAPRGDSHVVDGERGEMQASAFDGYGTRRVQTRSRSVEVSQQADLSTVVNDLHVGVEDQPRHRRIRVLRR